VSDYDDCAIYIDLMGQRGLPRTKGVSKPAIGGLEGFAGLGQNQQNDRFFEG